MSQAQPLEDGERLRATSRGRAGSHRGGSAHPRRRQADEGRQPRDEAASRSTPLHPVREAGALAMGTTAGGHGAVYSAAPLQPRPTRQGCRRVLGPPARSAVLYHRLWWQNARSPSWSPLGKSLSYGRQAERSRRRTMARPASAQSASDVLLRRKWAYSSRAPSSPSTSRRKTTKAGTSSYSFPRLWRCEPSSIWRHHRIAAWCR